jgi:hypothetical protein
MFAGVLSARGLVRALYAQRVNSQRQVPILQQLKIFFGESSSVRLRGPDDFPLMPRLPLVEELSRPPRVARNCFAFGDALQATVLKITALQMVARVTKT